MNHHCSLIGALIVVAGYATSTGMAEPIVIYDSGHTKPLPNPSATFQQPSQAHRPTSPDDLALLFPVRTPSMRPGSTVPGDDTERLERLRRLPGPLFLIGSDDLSLRWLADRRRQLTALGAIGFLIDADSIIDYQTVLSIAGAELVIVPSSAEPLAGVLGLRHYPVLLTREGIIP